ncbi:SURF1 family protein [Novosphingobium sp. FSY-8]|uniref:SURF1-like protein n=1 Tax=Novosphingobium ovatum TaxID=1908523 RepID=A0ABW9XD69_9SPHN|nr:SURF1 family cytochrome oxidase biogenesis protein [Novosphingobium ovatum]NBC36478.1 SURF1 family protein [Novosphingobium ovatum]
MRRRIPLIPTLLVLAAAGYMVHLGLWQIDRLHQKQAQIARHTAAIADSRVVSIGVVWAQQQSDAFDFRRTQFWCQQVMSQSAQAGRNAAGAAGWAQVARCLTAPVDTQSFRPTQAPQGVLADVVIGWSQTPATVAWSGGMVRGRIVPGGAFRHHVVADPPLAGLVANAAPDPRNVPNNHLSYAVQWFLFAGVALVIYGLALRRRMVAAPQ